MKLKVLDLFSGIGGFSLGLERSGGFETVAFCEIEKFCQKVLKKHWPDVPIYEDVRTLEHDGPVDLICGGYPCQPFSVAGQRKGKEDDRHLWPAMFSLIKKHRPDWVIGENVAGHIDMGLDEVLADLEGENYTVQTFIIPACAVDARHRRDRLWIVANANKRCGETGANGTRRKEGAVINRGRKGAIMADTKSKRSGKCGDSNKAKRVTGGEDAQPNGSGSNISNTGREGLQGRKEARYNEENGEKPANKQLTRCGRISRDGTWPTEPPVGRVANGVPRRVDRLKALGNAVVPQIPEIIGNAILESISND